jgi:hypothetical protein
MKYQNSKIFSTTNLLIYAVIVVVILGVRLLTSQGICGDCATGSFLALELVNVLVGSIMYWAGVLLLVVLGVRQKNLYTLLLAALILIFNILKIL